MIKNLILTLSPEQGSNISGLAGIVARTLNMPPLRVKHIEILKKSIDARKPNIKVILSVNAFIDEEPKVFEPFHSRYQKTLSSRKVVIIGSGPAGLFAALKCIELGAKPIVLERGKNVSDRKQDIAIINRPDTAGLVNIHSNYSFGEGGAGTFSDGKLYTRSTKRGNVNDILKILVEHGANPEIIYDSHPHIGSDKLPGIITNIRNTIINAGGEFHFNTFISDFIISNGKIKSAISTEGKEFEGDAFILATGHSATDIYELLISKNISLESKPFAMGVRAEHPQELIDSIQYKSRKRSPYLPTASYKLVTQVEGRGVFSFCMCPGGIIVPAASKPGEVIVNGMSNSKRNSPYANSGIVVTINPEELISYQQYGALAGLKFQQDLEIKCFDAAGKEQKAPAQRMTDFCIARQSATLGKTSFNPGVTSVALHEILPDFITLSLQKAFIDFGKKMKGYYTSEAMLLAPESRTSSPVRIPRHPEKLCHFQIENLYPSGEGAGYAGGIVSSAIDGENSAIAAVGSLG
ncbi:MAG: NAD(P)/FAD-dependent oxidoreductase [Bacteroidetes bacterium]|nr:NAD(P)/FAD-dependent oxidoreductase [Bacteroidota bacterium]